MECFFDYSQKHIVDKYIIRFVLENTSTLFVSWGVLDLSFMLKFLLCMYSLCSRDQAWLLAVDSWYTSRWNCRFSPASASYRSPIPCPSGPGYTPSLQSGSGRWELLAVKQAGPRAGGVRRGKGSTSPASTWFLRFVGSSGRSTSDVVSLWPRVSYRCVLWVWTAGGRGVWSI